MKRTQASYFGLGLLVGGLLTTVLFAFITRAEKGRGEAGGASARIILKLGHALDQSHPVHAGMEYMAKRLAELSEGAVELRIFPNGQLGSEPECIEQLQRGALAMVKTSTAAMEGFVPEMAVFGLPYLFRDEDHYWRVLLGPIGRELLAAGQTAGIHGLCYYDSGSRSFYTIDQPILTPQDLKGEKIRVLPSRMAMDLISTMGGSPTPVPWGELYTALQQGMVDGAENNPPSYLTSRHYEVAKHYSLDEHSRIPDMVIFSKTVWDPLPPQVRAWIEQAASDSVVYQRQLWREKSQQAMAQLQAAGVQIHQVDQAAFAAAAAPLFDSVKGTPVGQLADRIRSVP